MFLPAADSPPNLWLLVPVLSQVLPPTYLCFAHGLSLCVWFGHRISGGINNNAAAFALKVQALIDESDSEKG